MVKLGLVLLLNRVLSPHCFLHLRKRYVLHVYSMLELEELLF